MATKNTKNLKIYGACPIPQNSFVVFVIFVAKVFINL